MLSPASFLSCDSRSKSFEERGAFANWVFLGNKAGIVPRELLAWSVKHQELMCAVPVCHPLQSAEAVTLQQPTFVQREMEQAVLEGKPQVKPQGDGGP